MKIMGIMKKIICLFVVVINLVVCIGCNHKIELNGYELEPVTLKMYLIGEKPRDFDEVYDKVNKIMKEKINTTLDVEFMKMEDIDRDYESLFQEGEYFDLIFTAVSWAHYNEVATKNGFFEITEDMVKEYAPNIYINEPKEAWKQAKIDGKIYMIPSDQLEYYTDIFAVRGDLMEKYGIDNIENYNELENYMDEVSKDTESNVKVISNSGKQNLQYPYMIERYGYKTVGGTPIPSIGYDIHDNSGNIFNFVDKPEYLEYAKKMKEFSDKGYWQKDSISEGKAKDSDFLEGNAAVMTWNIFNVCDRVQRLNRINCDYDAKVIDQTKGEDKMINTFTNNGMAINSLSKHPQRALMALDLLRYNEDIYNLTWYGIEGKHSKKTGDRTYESLDDAVGFPIANVCPWGWYSQKYARNPLGESERGSEIFEDWKENNTITNAIIGFAFDNSKVKSECDKVNKVIEEYGVPIDLGMEENVDEAVKEYRKKLKEAGIDKILEECTKQIKIYRKNYYK